MPQVQTALKWIVFIGLVAQEVKDTLTRIQAKYGEFFGKKNVCKCKQMKARADKKAAKKEEMTNGKMVKNLA
jgi:hypothetical protein